MSSAICTSGRSPARLLVIPSMVIVIVCWHHLKGAEGPQLPEDGSHSLCRLQPDRIQLSAPWIYFRWLVPMPLKLDIVDIEGVQGLGCSGSHLLAFSISSDSMRFTSVRCQLATLFVLEAAWGARADRSRHRVPQYLCMNSLMSTPTRRRIAQVIARGVVVRGLTKKMTAPRGGGEEPPPPPPPSAEAGNDPVTPTSALVSGLNRRGSRGADMSTFSMEVFDNEVVPSTLNSIAPILHVAAEIESERPRVAYLCRFYAFEKAHRLDQNSIGRGVRQFKTALLQRLEKDNSPSLSKCVKKSDAHEIESFYQQYYKNYIRVLDKGEQANRAQLGKAYQTAGVLFEVLCTVNTNEKVEVNPEVYKDVQEKKDIYAQFNILPLDAASASQSIMQLEKIKEAVVALQNTWGLTWPSAFEPQRQKGGDLDLLDWLRAKFGFQSSSYVQRDSVRNQREHLILLLANVHIRLEPKLDLLSKLDDRAVDVVMTKLFRNYRKCCNFLSQKHSLRFPQCAQPQEIQQRKILYLGLYLLIWGEAANIRYMPECLCYIFHNMAYELHGLLTGNVSIVTEENIRPSYGGDEEAFLKNVVTPIYRVIRKVSNTTRSMYTMAYRGFAKKRKKPSNEKYPGNTATIVLDGDNIEACKHSYIMGILKARAWCRANSRVIDLSDHFGPEPYVWSPPYLDGEDWKEEELEHEKSELEQNWVSQEQYDEEEQEEKEMKKDIRNEDQGTEDKLALA
ncbi:hypothetical protein U9M48_015785 [Paspalum notatum var. saurae]|uniref:1,3-beta-glucan synthase n=1 Tax=Paspalum notatum var. saurae TaxID=547442 RepID=A0AAQ3T5S7_PASNO